MGYQLLYFGSKYSNRNKLGLSLVVAGLSCIPVALIPIDQSNLFNLNALVTIAFTSLCKIGISISTFYIYVYPSQIFPTSVRNSLVASILCFGKVGAMMSPHVNLLRFTVWQPLPYYIFAINSILAGILTVFLPNELKIKHEI